MTTKNYNRENAIPTPLRRSFKATPHKAHLTDLHEISLHIFQHISQKFLDRRIVPCVSLLKGGAYAEFLYNPTANPIVLLSHKLCAAYP